MIRYILLIFFLFIAVSANAQVWVCHGDKLATPFPSWYFEYARIDLNEGVWLGRYDSACIEGQAHPYTNGEFASFSAVPGSREQCIQEFRYTILSEDTLGLELRYKDSGYFMPYKPHAEQHVVEFHSEDALYVRFYVVDKKGIKSDLQVIEKDYGKSTGLYKKFGQERYAVKMRCSMLSDVSISDED